MKSKRLWAVLLALILACMTAAGCRNAEDMGENQEETEEFARDDAILKVGDRRVSQNEAAIFWLMLKNRYEAAYGPDVWTIETGEGRTFLEDAYEQLLEEMEQVYILCAQAEEQGITADPESEKELQTSVSEYLAGLSEEETNRYGLTQERVYQVYHDCLVAQTVFEQVTAGVSVSIPDAQIRQARVLAMTFPTGEASPKAKLSKLLEAAKKLTGEEEIRSYFVGNSLDEEVEYVIGADTQGVDDTLVTQALLLKTGEYSEIFETEKGMTFLYCVNASDEEAIRAKKTEMILARQREAFAQQYEKWLEKTSVKRYQHEIDAFLEKLS